MKHAKRFLALLLALVMVMALAVSASAVDITIDDDNITGASYAAYKLLDATNAVDSEGKGTDNFAYTVNETYRAILAQVLGITENPASDSAIIAAIAAKKDNADAVQAFANAVYAAIKAANPAISTDYTTTDNEFDDVAQGYYLIVETALGSTGEGGPTDTFSLVMLDTKGQDAITVETKENVPTVEKTVKEVNDSTGDTSWGESADHDIGDTVQFKIVGTVSDEYANYTSYRYQFTDTMEDGLTMDFDSIRISIGSVDVTEQFYLYNTKDSTDTNNPNRSNGFIAYTDLKVLDEKLENVAINKDTEIIVEYSATLNEDALRGAQGNKNRVVLYYENNPYTAVTPGFNPEDQPETPPDNPPGQTPPDVTIIFTFVGDVNKVHKVNGENVALPGAGFTLYKWVIKGVEKTENGQTIKVDGWVAIGEEVKSDAEGKLAWEGLDAGKYKLVETSVPAGYNKAEDLEFEVEATYDQTTNPHELIALTIKDGEKTLSSGDSSTFSISSDYVFSTTIVNNAGTELPSTGGIGTTILYIAGGILVLAAIVLLVTKKRMADAE